MSTDDRILRLENAMATLAELSANQEGRIAHLEETTARLQESTMRLQESFLVLVELASSQDEGQEQLRAAQAESERKIAALADAHIRTEDALARLTGMVDNLATKVDVIVDIVQGGLSGPTAE
ncbi:MAG TPA: hypothetical protein VE775_07105 [Pyrinomonadaceae bacterium]|jgi:chromosome segregation ATPase|nr:hypothetical protein [Pyrinomonadaceae bacterium]